MELINDFCLFLVLQNFIITYWSFFANCHVTQQVLSIWKVIAFNYQIIFWIIPLVTALFWFFSVIQISLFLGWSSNFLIFDLLFLIFLSFFSTFYISFIFSSKLFIQVFISVIIVFIAKSWLLFWICIFYCIVFLFQE